MNDRKKPDRAERSGRSPYPSKEEVGGGTERIAKRLARAGVASRRDAEAMVAAGRVSVNGKVLTSPAINVGPGDRIEVDGAPLPAIERTRLFLFHKPAGVVTTNRDPEGRRTVFDVLPKDLPRLITVGRLDLNTEGLLLLTNDGGLARVLELPSTGWLRRYRVRVHGKVDLQALEGLKDGIAVDGVFYGAIEAALDRVQGSNAWLTIGLREGKNREVRNVLGALDLDVTRLIRVSYGPFQLGDLAEGTVQEIKGRTLRDQLGERLIREAGADFDAPVAKPFSGKKQRESGAEEKPGKPGKRAEMRGPREERGRTAPGEKSAGRPDRQQRRDAALERLDTRDRRPGSSAQKRDEPLPRRRASNVWMAPGARPVGKKKVEDNAAGEDRRKDAPRDKPDRKRKSPSSRSSRHLSSSGEKRERPRSANSSPQRREGGSSGGPAEGMKRRKDGRKSRPARQGAPHNKGPRRGPKS